MARRSRDGYSFALPSAGTCLRRPHFFQQRKKWGKERRQKLRFCTSSARYTRQRFAAYSRGHSLSSPLSVKRTACTLTGAEADAAACPSHGRCVSLLPPHPSGLPLAGSVLLNGTPQSLPPGGKVSAKLTDEGSPIPPAGVLTISPAASAATYPLRCSAPQWARFDNRQKRPAYQPLPSLLSAAAAQEVQAVP